MQMSITGFDDVIKRLDKFSDKSKMDEIAMKAVDAALPTVVSSVKSHIHPHDVASGVTATKAKDNAYGVFGVAKITGHDSKGQSNAMRAAVLEYGRHDGRGGHIPWRDVSAASAEGTAKSIMEQTVRSEMECD